MTTAPCLARTRSGSSTEPVVPDLAAAPAPRTTASHPLAGRAAGWTLLLAGVALLPLPGPGSLVILAGVRVLVPHHAWAARGYGSARDRILRATAAGVSTWPRVLVSAVGPLWLTLLALAYVADLQVPSFTLAGLHLGPGLPLHGATTTVGLVVSAVATAALLVLAVVRWGPGRLRG